MDKMGIFFFFTLNGWGGTSSSGMNSYPDYRGATPCFSTHGKKGGSVYILMD